MQNDKYKVLNRDMMKYLAITIMFIGHAIGWINLMYHPDDQLAIYGLPVPLLVLAGMSLFCPPVMFFFIADGYKYTRDRKKYALRLLLFACITQPFDWLVMQPIFGWWESNVIFTLFFGLLAVTAWESRYKLWQRIALALLCAGATVLVYADWMIFGVLLILCLHIFRERPKARFWSYTVLTGLNAGLSLLGLADAPAGKVVLYAVVAFAAMMLAYFCMTTFYNGKKGKHPVFAKWFFYAFYPLHYLVIYLIKLGMDNFSH